ncbi:MAG: hypothetical protein WCV90_03745 [Candidatus Woesearchaeota archaeon]
MNKVLLLLGLMVMGLFLVSCGNIAGQAVGGTVFLTCNDSDGGNNMYIPGVVSVGYTSGGKMYTIGYGDRNLSITSLYETACKSATGNSSTNLVSTYSKFCPKGIGIIPYFSPITNKTLNLSYCKCTDNTQCGAGYTCSNGLCQKPSISCIPQCAGKTCGDNGCAGICGTCATGQTCNSTGSCVAPACSDTDGGKNLSVKGTVKGIFGNGQLGSKSDQCVNSTQLYEWSCNVDGNHVMLDSLQCQTNGGCKDGACVNLGCTPSTVANGTVGAYPGCAINCSYGFALSNGACVKVACNSNADCPATFTQSCNISNNQYNFKNASYICSNPGTAQAACLISAANTINNTCPYGCNGNVCATAPTNCTPGPTGKFQCGKQGVSTYYARKEYRNISCSTYYDPYMELCGYDASSCTDGIGCCKKYGTECQGNVQINYTTDMCNAPNDKIITKSTNCSSYVGYSSGRSLVCGNFSYQINECLNQPCVPGEISYNCDVGSSTQVYLCTLNQNWTIPAYTWRFNGTTLPGCPADRPSCTVVGKNIWEYNVSICK